LPVIVERQVNTESQLQDLSPLARRRRILLFAPLFALRASAFDPKRTSGSSLNEPRLNRYDWSVPKPRGLQ
jgi:hypothetical protein